MIIAVDPKSPVPVFQQIADGVKSAIAKGVVAPGEVIPSVRQMAAQALVNPNTVARAYRDLEREGVVTTRKGLAVYVSDRAAEICREDRRDALSGKLADVVSEALSAGISSRELRTAFDKAMKSETTDEHR
jgi:GntR family transcriptional regulator